MRPPLNAGENHGAWTESEAVVIASMRPPLNAGENLDTIDSQNAGAELLQ